MKLTRKIEAEILKMCEEYWERYLAGDLKTLARFLTDDFKLIGTTEVEVFHDKKTAMKYLKATIDQIAGVLIRENSIIKLAPIGETVIVVEQFDGYVKVNGQPSFYSTIRVTSIFKCIRGKWLIAHQHGSLPDPNTNAGETLAAKRIEKENRELKDAVRRHTKDLEDKNRELEIEASLERVRGRAMAMQSSSELAELIGMIHGEIARLDKNLDRSFIMLFDDSGSCTWWMSDNKNLSLKRGYNIPYHKHPPYLACLKSWRKRQEVWKYVLKGAVKKKWDNFIFKETELAQLPKVVKSSMVGAPVAYWSSSFNKYGCISTGSFAPLENSSFDLMVRFSRMFEQTYTRFLDLKKAEAQARDAQVEAALERIRSVSMAIRKSDELFNIIRTVFGEWKKLGLELYECNINLLDREKKEWTNWGTGIGEAELPRSFLFPWFDDPFVIQLYEDTCAGISHRTYFMEGKVKRRFLKTMFVKTDFKNAPQEYRDAIYGIPELYLTHAFMRYGSMDIVGPEKPPESIIEILRRFVKVFEQAYTRYLDVVQAEAQAREAQIQLALERVRARTMAMQKSEELNEVAILLFKQVGQLGIKTWTTGFNVWSDDNNFYTDYVASPQGNLVKAYTIDAREFPVFVAVAEAKKRGEEFWVSYLEGDLLKETYKALDSYGTEKQYDKILEDGYQFPSEQYNHFVFGPKVSLMFITYERVPEAYDIFKRFGKVFQQTYTRFLDLQKAEAQAHEALVEAALERVRSRTMAMHKSEELLDVITVVCEQVQHVGIKFSSVSFGKNSATFDMDFWGAAPDLKTPIRLYAPYKDISIYQRLKAAVDQGKTFFTDTFTAEETRVWYEHLVDHNPSMFSQKSREYLVSRAAMTRTTVLLKNVFLFAINHSIVNYSKEENEILIRFANVFEQAYTRFLDLQKAEAQAHEAQVEAALEKVRARTMGMQRSDELAEVAVLMFQQVRSFGLEIGGCGFNIWNKDDKECTAWVSMPDGRIAPPYKLPLTENPVFIRIYESRLAGEDFYEQEYDSDTLSENYRYMSTLPVVGELIKKFEEAGGAVPTYQVDNVVHFSHGNLIFISHKRVPEAHDMFKRFGKVFEQTYTRFLDLQNAEAQARESQIQLALERIRARTMAMQRSVELSEVSQLLHHQFHSLGVQTVTCAFMFPNEKTNTQSGWTVLPDGTLLPSLLEFPLFGDAILDERYSSWKEKRPLHRKVLTVEENRQHHQFLRERVASQISTEIFPKLPDELTFTNANFTQGYLMTFTAVPLTVEEEDILIRFARVFEQTYTRFQDLERAEAQSREANIEAALERVRARAMAMHTAKELNEVVHELRTQMGLLGQKDLNTCVIHLNDEYPDHIESFASLRKPGSDSEILDFHVMIPKRLKIIEAALAEYYSDRQDYVLMYEGEAVTEWNAFIREVAPAAIAEMGTTNWQKFVDTPVSQEVVDNLSGYWACADFQGGTMLFATSDPPEEESRTLLRRFANVFGLAYRRFSDLKKAEAQAREATIEAALEKIRSRSLGMHNSAEIKDVCVILFEKLKELGLVFDGGAGIHLFKEDSKDSLLYVAAPELNGAVVCHIPYDEHEFAGNPMLQDIYSAMEKAESIVNRHYSFEEKNRYFNYLYKHNENIRTDIPLNARSFNVTLIAEKNCLLGANSWTGQHFSDSDVEVLKRVTHVFEQAYIRFLDLQKSEAQAREATIEAALEKIRSRSLGMHGSNELNDVVRILFEKLRELDLPFDGGAGLYLFSEGSRDMSFWVTNGRVAPVCNFLPWDDENHFEDNPIIKDIWNSKQAGEPGISRHYSSIEKDKMFEYTSKHNDASKIPESEKKFVAEAQTYTATFIPEKNSLLSVDSWTKQEMSAGDIEVLKRVTRVFEQAYVRFLDLQKAEVHAKEAVRQASLDRVRAEIASMRTVQDLDRITPLIWRELNALNIPFIRCGVFIMDDNAETIHNFLATPDGKAIAVFDLPYSTPEPIASMLKHWQQKKMYRDHWDKSTVMDLGKILVDRKAFSSIEQYLSTLPSEEFYPYCMSFQQGMLYVGNTNPLKEDELAVLQSLADAFSTAYARYDDFNKLEEAKQQVDTALVELKQTQQQLVQSEKMASLGELTAGIAHEIQNPLNFVNNFSEVSYELIDEMKTEIESGNIQGATELVESIKQNLEKITHHGKRADGIVKGMLQHSRTGSGQKEQTDINVLCDEYLRLAYHGYRAKDKSFNANFETDFDSSLPKVSVVPQDIGRVILNLINNAFYAVNEKSKQVFEGYAPKVIVSTKKLDDRIEVRIRDNGPGIPDSIKEKVFQPFFTTKPTGQGTGLGLSLAYDIVTKLHGGELRLETKVGDGSEFIIVLPVR